MKTIEGNDAIQRMREVSKIPRGCFAIEFFTYNRTKETTNGLRKCDRAIARKALRSNTFQVNGDLLFAFKELSTGDNKMCYKHLIHKVGFPPYFEMMKVKWFKQ
jgi:hypothetical protein